MSRTSPRSASAISPPTVSCASAPTCAVPASPSGPSIRLQLNNSDFPRERQSACRSSTRTRARSACWAAGADAPLDHRLAVIAGTSACHLAVSTTRYDVPGVWGPYFGALVPDRWLTEAGISASGAFLDHALRMHPAGPLPFEALEQELAKLGPAATTLAADRHWQPNVLGNRAPLADPTLTGGTAGVRMRDDIEDLALWYLAALQALAYASRHIVDALRDAGRAVDLLIVCGGSAANAWWLQTHADALGLPVARPEEPDAVLLGAAMLGATAAGVHPSLEAAMSAMTRLATMRPADPSVARYHDAKYAVYRRMLDDHRAYREMMVR